MKRREVRRSRDAGLDNWDTEAEAAKHRTWLVILEEVAGYLKANPELAPMVGVDFDKTVYDADRLKARLLKERYGIVARPDHLHERFIEEGGPVSLDQYHEVKRLVYEVAEHGLTAHDYKKAARFLRKFQRMGFKLKIVSNRTPLSSEIARRWLHQKGLYVEFVGVGLEASKAEATIGCEVFVDNDDWKLDLLKESVKFVVHLVSEPLEEDASPKYKNHGARADSWDRAFKYIILYIYYTHVLEASEEPPTE